MFANHKFEFIHLSVNIATLGILLYLCSCCNQLIFIHFIKIIRGVLYRLIVRRIVSTKGLNKLITWLKFGQVLGILDWLQGVGLIHLYTRCYLPQSNLVYNKGHEVLRRDKTLSLVMESGHLQIEVFSPWLFIYSHYISKFLSNLE